jgi:hypothetical protein
MTGFNLKNIFKRLKIDYLLLIERVILVALFILPASVILKAQTVPVGTPVIEESYRRLQLLGEIDSAISFTVRPLNLSFSTKTDNPYDPLSTLEEEGWSKSGGIFRFADDKGRIQLLPIIWLQQYNTHHPYSLNDGAMIPARGYQTMISGGLFAKFGPLNVQLRPEYVYAENKDFQGFFAEQPDEVWAEYYVLQNIIDLPEKFGDEPYNKIFWGQSSARLNYGAFSLGLSTENLWWGPGIRNSLVMGNSAPGFFHFTLNTVRPAKTFIGSFEGQIICGKLENSGYFPPDTSHTYNGVKLYQPKRDEWRYINGMVISYHPKWVPGLFLGLTRTHIAYYVDMGNTFKDYFPILTPFTKEKNYGENESSYPSDQRLSLFARWIWSKAKAEIYTEYFREDHAFDIRDIILEAEHTHAYLFGFQKIIALKRFTNNFLQFNLELTKIEQTTTNPERPSKYLYGHYAYVYHGYTNKGQLLGAAIGPGSNLQSASISWVKGLKSIGIGLERYVHNNDFHNAIIKDPRANWVDVGITSFGDWNWKNLLFSAKLQFINSYNYQHYYQPVFKSENSYWVSGKNTFNFQAQLSTSFRF